MTTIKERPILFQGAMVRALLDGTKTQTRRVVKVPMKEDPTWVGGWAILHKALTVGIGVFNDLRGKMLGDDPSPCPYGKPGDRLWVRETWQGPLFDDMEAYRAEPGDFHKPAFCEYAADGGPAPEFMTMDDELVCRWRPSIHMPRWASRILLEVVSVRVERLQDISDQDACAEGCPCYVCGAPLDGRSEEDCHCFHRQASATDYRYLWESINGAGSWDANPWVWVVEFKRVAP